MTALGQISGRLPNPWRLCCVGRDDGLRSSLEDQAKSLGIGENVLFLEGRSAVNQLYQMADVSVLASHEEGFPNVVLEAMAEGRPVIATDVGGVRDALVDGRTGRLATARNPASLAAAIIELALDPEKRTAMGQAGRARVEEFFSLDGCVDRYESLYRGLLDNYEAPVDALINNSAGLSA